MMAVLASILLAGAVAAAGAPELEVETEWRHVPVREVESAGSSSPAPRGATLPRTWDAWVGLAAISLLGMGLVIRGTPRPPGSGSHAPHQGWGPSPLASGPTCVPGQPGAQRQSWLQKVQQWNDWVWFVVDSHFNPLSPDYWRRGWAMTKGLGRFAGNVAAGTVQAGWGLVTWLWKGITAAPGSPEEDEVAQDLVQFVKTAPVALWQGVRQDWATTVRDLGRVHFDPDMTDAELEDWAEATAGAVSDMMLLRAGLRLAAAKVSRARIMAEMDRLAIERLGIQGGFRQVLAGLGVSDAAWWRAVDEVRRTGEIEATLRRLGHPELAPYFYAAQEGINPLVWNGDAYAGRFTLKPWLLSSNQPRRVQGTLANVKGAYAEDLARQDILKLPGNPQFIWDFHGKNVATSGTDALIRFDNGEYWIVEVKFRTGRITVSDFKKYLKQVMTPDGPGLEFRRDVIRQEAAKRGMTRTQLTEFRKAMAENRATLVLYTWRTGGVADVLTFTTQTTDGTKLRVIHEVRQEGGTP